MADSSRYKKLYKRGELVSTAESYGIPVTPVAGKRMIVWEIRLTSPVTGNFAMQNWNGTGGESSIALDFVLAGTPLVNAAPIVCNPSCTFRVNRPILSTGLTGDYNGPWNYSLCYSLVDDEEAV